MTQTPQIAFFGTSRLSVHILHELKAGGMLPKLLVTTPDKPSGRHLAQTPNEVKVWATENNVPIFETNKLDDAAFAELSQTKWDLFIVASYGHIVPKRFLDLPKNKTLNVHPSLLPLLRGPSPIPYTILEDQKDTGVTIMLMDEEVDHGPILATEHIHINEWPSYYELKATLASIGGKLLAKIIPQWIAGAITPIEQDHAKATFTKKITKQEAEINLSDDPYLNFRKIQAYLDWLGPYFFIEKDGRRTRIVIKKASYKNNELVLERVVPEGKKEMSYQDYIRGSR